MAEGQHVFAAGVWRSHRHSAKCVRWARPPPFFSGRGNKKGIHGLSTARGQKVDVNKGKG
jgi:hypothetical protein